MKVSNFNQIFNDFKSLKVLIIGDIMLDSYLWGSVERISPEAPVPIHLVNKRENRLGGAGNVLLNIKSLGATPIICSVIGNDADGKMINQQLITNNLSTEGLIKSDERITTVKQRIISGSHHLLRIDSETDAPLGAIDKKNLLAKIKSFMPEIQAIIFEDYDKGVIDEELISIVTEWAIEKNIPITVDPKKRNFLFYKKVNLFKPNLKEMREGLKVEINPDLLSDLQMATDKLRTQLDAEAIMLTLSERGVLINKNGTIKQFPAHIRNIADVSGAGDTVIGVASLCVALRLSPDIVAALSNLAGGLVCEHIGVVPIDSNELLQEANMHLAGLL